EDLYMKIIFCRWGSICENGMLDALKRLGHEVIIINERYNEPDYDKDYILKLAEVIQNNRDAACVMSVNFIPVISRASKPFKLPYISLTVDCPCSTLYSNTLAYPHNRVFVFDKLQYDKFRYINPNCIFHTPLATDIESWDRIQLSPEDHKRYDCDVSFVGSLYQEMCLYNRIENKLPEYTQGFVEGLIAAQQNVYGYNFIEDSISDEWAEQFRIDAGLSSVADDYINDLKGIIADVYIGYKCTEQERINTLNQVSQHFSTDLYTQSDTSSLSNIHNKGPADSLTMMPKIFKCSKINLNITNKAIKSGLSQRIFDVMGCGGFLITNYQPEVLDLFVPDEEIVMYESLEDLIDKIGYYLIHEEERNRIAVNGYRKVKENFTYDKLCKALLSVI
ncbi:MAG: DUF3880 domain-containing protein, partial [Wujia sp.]